LAVTAIPEFARQAQIQIVAPADALRSVTTPEIKGAFDAREALRRLIARTDLEIAGDDGMTVTLRRKVLPVAPPKAAVRAPEPTLPLASATEVDPLFVFGSGRVRQVQTVAGAELARAAPGSSPIQLIEKLPSVSITYGDAFGMNESSTRVAVRNFAQGRLGFTLDDVPLGDMTHDDDNGLHISRAISGENVASVELAQGPGSLEGASSSNLGGTIKFVSHAPSQLRGASFSASAGSNNTLRGFARLETGELDTGLRVAGSYAYSTTEKWQGDGRQYLQQVNLKAVQPAGEGSLTGFVNLSRRRDSDPQDLSLEMIRRLGLGWDNISRDWPLAVRLAEIGANRGDTGVPPRNPGFGVVFPAPFTSVTDAYYDATSARDDALTGLTWRTPVGDRVDAKATIYGHWGRGQDLLWTPFKASPNYGLPGATANDAPISLQSTEYSIARRGVLASATARFGNHAISGGLWLEDNDFIQARRFYGLDRSASRRRYDDFQTDPFLTEWEYHFLTRTRQFHVQDIWTAGDALTVSAGFKSESVNNQATTRTGPQKTGGIRARDHFLPEVGIRFRLSSDAELFADYGRGMRAFTAANTSGPFATTQAAFEAVRTTLKPEISDSIEAGVRYTTTELSLLGAVYGVRFHNRLFSTPIGRGVLGDPLTIANVGSVTSGGAETAIVWRFARDWSLFGSYSYGRAVYDDDVFDGDGVLIGKTAGKKAVDAPEHLAKARLEYQGDKLFGRLDVSYTGDRYFTFENDRRVPAYTTVDLTIGHRFSGPSWRSGLELQLSVTNLLDARYISTIGSQDFPIRGDAQTLLAGPPREAFVTLRETF